MIMFSISVVLAKMVAYNVVKMYRIAQFAMLMEQLHFFSILTAINNVHKM
jgi:hypothetical protein